MKKILAVFALLLLLGGLATAQQILIVAQGTDAVTLDAADITDSPSATVSSHIAETLFELTPEGTIVPLLAESYEVSPDGKVWTIKLRQGVTFHDGTPFNAEAVKFNINRFLDPANAFAFRFLLDRVASVEVVDEYTVRFNLNTTFAPFLSHLTHNSVAMQSPTAIERFGEAFRDNPVGTGPFRFVSWIKGRQIDLATFENYWGERPGIDGVRFLAVPEATTRMAMVETGEAHVAVRVPPHDVPRLDAHPDITVDNTSSVRTIYIYFNHTKEPFTDVRVRRAINHAVDKKEIAEFLLGGAARPSDAPISPGIFGYTPIGFFEYNPELARQLLAEAGFPDGFSTTLYSPTGRYVMDIQIAEAVQSMLADVGITAEIVTLEWAAYLERTRQPADVNEVPMAMLGWGTVTGDADYGLFPLFHTSQHVPAGSNRSFFSNPLVDALLDEGRTTLDPERRKQIYYEAMRIIWEDAAWLFLHSETQLTAIRDEVQGFVVHPTERFLAHRASFR